MDDSETIIRFKNDYLWNPEFVWGDMELIDYIDIVGEQDFDDVINLLLCDFDFVEEIDESDIEYYIDKNND
jgi:hypothetical protein